jgi:exonuclease VII large subunit
MDLPSAADKIVEELNALNTNINSIPKTLAEVVDLATQTLSKRVDQLESKIHGNEFQDQIRNAVQEHNDLVLDNKINSISTGFSTELEELKRRFDSFENRLGSSDIQAEPQAEGQDGEDTMSHPGNEAESNPATKRSTKGRAPS